MARSGIRVAANVLLPRVIRFVFLSLVGILAGFVFTVLSASTANAAPTTVSGTISGIPNDAWGMAWGEKLVGGDWVEISTSYTKDLYQGQPYSVNLGEVTGSAVRVWAQFGSSSGSYLTGTDSFTVTSTSITKNFSLSPFNYKFNVSDQLACLNGSITASTTDIGYSERFTVGTSINDTGVANISVPPAINFVFSGRCNGDITFEVTNLSTNTLQTFPITIATPNVVGTISGVSTTNRVYSRVQSQLFNGVDNKWQGSEYGFATNSSGQFALNLPEGTYRLVAQPNWDEGVISDFVNSYSDSFTVTNSQVTVNFAMSSDPNVIFTISPTSVSSMCCALRLNSS